MPLREGMQCLADVRTIPSLAAPRRFCSACGVDAACNCGAPVIPAWDKATDHFEKNPNDNRSSRTIAKELGVGKSTVNDARNSTVQRRTVDDDRPTIDNPPKGNLWDDQDDREDEDQTVS